MGYHVFTYIGPQLSEALREQFREWKSNYQKIPKELLAKFPVELKTIIRTFTAGFLNEQCGIANRPKLRNHASLPPCLKRTSSTAKPIPCLTTTDSFIKHCSANVDTSMVHQEVMCIYKKALSLRRSTSRETQGPLPIIEFRGLDRKDMLTLVQLFSTDELDSLSQLSNERLHGHIVKYIPCKPFGYLKATRTLAADPRQYSFPIA